jgi:hypothetical protein
LLLASLSVIGCCSSMCLALFASFAGNSSIGRLISMLA